MLYPLVQIKYRANEKMEQFVEMVATARQKGFRNIRSHYDSNQIELTENYSLYDWFNNKDISENHKNFLYGMITLPFIRDEDKVIQEEYINSYFYFEDKEHHIEKTECLGLAASYLYNSLSISLSASPVWDKTILSVIIEKEDKIAEAKDVHNVSSKTSFNSQDIANFIESIGELTLVETLIEPEEKKVHLADHHGKAELQELCDRLKHSPYVIEMQSTDWGGNKFIRKVQSDGIIEIALLKQKSDTPYGYRQPDETGGRSKQLQK